MTREHRVVLNIFYAAKSAERGTFMRKTELTAITAPSKYIYKNEVRNHYDALRTYFKQRTRIDWNDEALDTFFSNLHEYPVGEFAWDSIFYYIDEIRAAYETRTYFDAHDYDTLIAGHHYTTASNRWHGDSAPVSFTLISKPREICRLCYGTMVFVEGCTMEIILDGENHTRYAQIEGSRFRCNVTNTCVDDLFCVEYPHFIETEISDEARTSATEAVLHQIEYATDHFDENVRKVYYYGDEAIKYARDYISTPRMIACNPDRDIMEKYLPIYDYLTQNDTADSTNDAPATVCPAIEISESICTDAKPQTPQEQFADLCKRFKAGYNDTAELKPTEEYNCTATDDRGRAKEYMEICNRIGIEKRLMAQYEKDGNTEGVDGCKYRIKNLHSAEHYVKRHADWLRENFKKDRSTNNKDAVNAARKLFVDYWCIEMDIDTVPLFVGDTKDFTIALTGQYFLNIMRGRGTDLNGVVIDFVRQTRSSKIEITEEALLHRFNKWLTVMNPLPDFDPDLDKWETTDAILWEFLDRRRQFYEKGETRYPTNEEIFYMMTKKENA